MGAREIIIMIIAIVVVVLTIAFNVRKHRIMKANLQKNKSTDDCSGNCSSCPYSHK